MDPLAEFLTGLFANGRIVLREPREDGPDEPVGGKAGSVLSRAFEAYRLDVAGTPIAFERGVALAAAERLRRACWALADRSRRPEDLERSLRMPRMAGGPPDHLSADLTLRYLPTVIRRARGFDPSDTLVPILGRLLREWPLSGVLVGGDEGPAVAPEFGHDGLNLLYAERFARHNHPAWRPGERAGEFVEMVGDGA